MNNIVSGVYCIENLLDNKKYIGQAKDFSKRTYHHRWNWEKETYEETSGENRPLWNAIKKYGEENFYIFMVEECEKEKLNFLETFYIKKFETLISQKGYNILSDGFSREGIHHTQESKNKISIANKGKKRTQETKDKISKAKIGVPRSPSSIEKTAASKRGKKLNPNHSQKIKDSFLKGRKMKNASSQHFGVSIDLPRNKWVATILITRGKRKTLGRYKTEAEAAKRYNNYVLENKLNKPLNIINEEL